VRIGVSLRTAYMVDDPAVGARWVVERAVAARDAGLDSLFVGDHHSTGPASYYQNVALLGRLLADWPSDRPAGVLMLLPLWPPVLAAELLGTLAAVHDGPLVLQCAVGGGDAQFAAMGASLRTRPSRFEAALDVIRRLLAGERVDSETFGVRGASIAPRPPRGFEVWIGAAADAAVDRAARLGDAFLCGPEATPVEAARLADHYRRRCEQHGTTPRLAVRRDVHVGRDAADTERVAGPIVAAGYRGFDPAALCVGGPDEVAEQLRSFAPMGYEEVLVRHLAEDHTEVLASFERLAAVRREVAA
jgi:alkanesulfonate monooxygenase SsuD/methylene tetrahydromethanopterin reductase-like flavin-dependent oxidoreductase (luciferase family)